MCALKLGSLFDGIGVFPLAASRNGIIPVWATATFQGAEVDWYIKAEDIILKKGAAMNPQPPKKDAPPAK